MDEKNQVSDEVKAAAAKRAAEARKAAQAKKAGGATRTAPKKDDAEEKPAKKPAPKKAAPKKEAPKKEEPEEEAEPEEEEEPVKEEKPAKKERLEVKQTDEEKKSVKGLRTGAIILWAVALLCEIAAFIFLKFEALNHTVIDQLGNVARNWAISDPEMVLLIGVLILDAVLCVIAAQLWKKSNRISPCLADSKLVRTLWHQLGVIMALVCLLPIGIVLIIKSDKLDKKTKTILTVAVAAIILAVGTSSVDFKQPSQEKVEELQQEAIASNAGNTVYWTTFGKSYHFDRNCRYIAGKATVEEGGTLNDGTLDDAFAANRWDPCNACAGGAEAAAAEDTTDTEALEPAA